MQQTLTHIIIFLTLMGSSLGLAHETHDHNHHRHSHAQDCEVNCVTTGSVDKTANSAEEVEVKKLAHVIHEAITGEHSHFHSFKDFLKSFGKLDTWKLWLRSIKNMPYAPLNYRRSINQLNFEQKNDLPQHAKNLFLLYSHGEAFEIFVVPTLGTMFGVSSSASAWVKSVVGTISYLTPLPGIEPACLALVGCYMASKSVRKGITWVNKGVSYLVFTPIQNAYDSLRITKGTFELAGEVLQQLGTSDQYEVETVYGPSKFYLKVREPSGRIALEFKFYVEERMSSMGWQLEGYLKSLRFLGNKPLLATSFAQIFGKNVFQAVKEIVNLENNGQSSEFVRKFYVKESKIKGSQRLVVFSDNGVFLEPQKFLSPTKFVSKIVKTCSQVLRVNPE